jgi:GH24 family phage-related lysozyme (muramidase)
MKRKVIFDTVRRMRGRGFTRTEVVALDAAIDLAMAQKECHFQDSGPSGPRVREERRTVGPEGLALIRAFEGCAKKRPDGLFEAYPDPGTGGAPWTIGWGATGPDIGPETVWTRAECDARLEADVARHAAQVSAALGDAPTNANQFDALVSFHYNTGAIGRATLTRKHIAGDFAGAASEFARWNRAGGRVLAGLTRRRAAEARLYRK